MRQVRDGEVNRLEVLFDRHQRALLHYFLHLTGNRAASEDLVQEAFFRVLKYRRSYQAENTFRAWLFQIGRNAYLDHLGRRKNEVAWAAETPEAASPDAAPDRLMEEKQETALLRQALAELPPEKREVVDNFAGAIHVTGGGSQIEVTLVRHNRADSAEKLAEAKREVKLEISEQGGEVKLHQDYHYGHHDDREGYRVAFDYDIQVPAGTALSLDNFNSEIAVKGTSGDFDLHAFNGHIEVDDVTGAGNVHTFNGPVKIAFRRNPERDLKVKTFNGTVDAYFQHGLNAELSYKTFNGGVFSDFDVTTVPLKASAEGSGTKYVYHSGRSGSGRIGQGGPKLEFEGFNGPIRLHEAKP